MIVFLLYSSATFAFFCAHCVSALIASLRASAVTRSSVHVSPSLLSCSTPKYVYPDQFSPRLRPAGRHRFLLRRQLPVVVAAVELRAELGQADCRSGGPGQSRADGADPVHGGE